jgi:alkylation response protein AidB-like acyl-CoA dehydrogenase
MSDQSSISESILEQLAALASDADHASHWPANSLNLLRQTDVYRWSVPKALGGAEYSTIDLLAAYEDLACACLTTAFIISQRDAAIRRIVAFAPATFQAEWLPPLASGAIFTTIGLSQLTTSRQHGQPALQVVAKKGNDHVLHGEIPWVTGADQAEFIVIGAKDKAGLQYLFGLPARHAGITIEPPLALMALAGSRTTRLLLNQVELDSGWLILGPVSEIPNIGRTGTGGLETSCLALGLARAAIGHLEQEAAKRAELSSTAHQLKNQLDALRNTMYLIARGELSAQAAASLRADATQLVLSATQIVLIAAKGTGYVFGHPVERWVRQALFFLVWSCPRPVQNQVMEAQLKAICQESD